MLKDLAEMIAADSNMASDPYLTKSTLEAVGNLLGNDSRQTETAEYQTMDEDTFEALALTVDSLISSSPHAVT